MSPFYKYNMDPHTMGVVQEVISSLSPMPLLTITSPTTIEKCSQLIPKQNDIFISSYPKSGTTWTQHIVTSLLLLHRKKVIMIKNQNQNDGASSNDNTACSLQTLQYDHVSDYAPFYEIDAHWDGDSLIEGIKKRHNEIGRRIFNTHLRGNMLPTTATATTSSGDNNVGKVIYVIRSPLDVCVSFYHHLSNQNEGCYEKGFDHFFQEWMAGDMPFGSWSDHVLSFAPKVASGEVMLLSYEEMVRNLQPSVERIVEFLELGDVITPEDVNDLLPTFEFASMKNDLKRFQPKSVTWKNEFKFLRKGVIGNHKETLNDEQINMFKRNLADRQFFEKLNLILGDSGGELESYMGTWGITSED